MYALWCFRVFVILHISAGLRRKGLFYDFAPCTSLVLRCCISPSAVSLTPLSLP
jgi:hypothetical protein